MLLKPEIRPISQDQLFNEFKGIYAGSVTVEKKYVEIDQQQSRRPNSKQCELRVFESETKMLSQPESRPIPRDRLVNGSRVFTLDLTWSRRSALKLVSAELKQRTSLQMDSGKLSSRYVDMSSEWQALNALPWTLLYEHQFLPCLPVSFGPLPIS
jgi:hypothetical protein